VPQDTVPRVDKLLPASFAAEVCRIPSVREYASVKLVCKHCSGTTFRLLTGTDGRTAAECLTCGRASSFDQSVTSSASAPPDKPGPASK
jgi:hypothetical protein